jgi:hypothetical protein
MPPIFFKAATHEAGWLIVRAFLAHVFFKRYNFRNTLNLSYMQLRRLSILKL